MIPKLSNKKYILSQFKTTPTHLTMIHRYTEKLFFIFFCLTCCHGRHFGEKKTPLRNCGDVTSGRFSEQIGNPNLSEFSTTSNRATSKRSSAITLSTLIYYTLLNQHIKFTFCSILVLHWFTSQMFVGPRQYERKNKIQKVDREFRLTLTY